MKITGLTGSIHYPSLVREKQGDSPADGESRGSSQHQNSSKEESSDPGEDEEASPENVGQAVDAFQVHLATHAAGLNASVEGQGPGLKVILKDGHGGVVRQFTGEEFLKMREAASKDGRIRGKILDQKL